jgi:hypothetical protein
MFFPQTRYTDMAAGIPCANSAPWSKGRWGGGGVLRNRGRTTELECFAQHKIRHVKH